MLAFLQRYNKGSAATLGAGLAAVLANVTDLDADTIGYVAMVSAGLVTIIFPKNKD
ncbi:MAG: hypothetical protein QNJ62_04920 [Methyloceanibacter sp.]|nr:hypothetical protein [Methyloceanibacter sp.]